MASSVSNVLKEKGVEVFSGVMSFRVPNLILAGIGVLGRLGPTAAEMGAQRALIVTDKGVMDAGIGRRVKDLLEKAGIWAEIYDGVISDPDIACAEACVEAAKKNSYDLIVGVGGGSSMDVAATAAVMLTNPGKVSDYLGVNLVKRPGIPTILIPTTAGTGAEVTPYAAIGDTGGKLKKSIISPYIFARVSIVDPELTLSMPPSVTSSSGIDALSHAIESYAHTQATPMTDLFAKEAIMLIGRSLRDAVANGQNLGARCNMSMGSLFAGIALANTGGTGVHALAHALGGHFHATHGVACGLLLPYVMEHYVSGNVPKFAQIASFLGERADHGPLLDQAHGAARAVKAIYRDLRIPQSLTELKIPEEAIPVMAKSAVTMTRMIEGNPRNITVEDAIQIYKKAL